MGMTYALHLGDCLAVLPTLADNSVDAIVTDPPAGISFMGKKWDHDKGGRDAWIAWLQSVAVECLRVLKPGGHMLIWALPRTSHWTATAVENAGFEIRDRVSHIFGQGFPKSVDVGKHIDKQEGMEREVVGPVVRRGDKKAYPGLAIGWDGKGERFVTAPATPEAAQWDGWGTALKPAMEDWWLCRKPLEKGLTVAANVLKWGTGGINVDACRVEGEAWTKKDGANGSGFATGKFLGDARGENSRPYSERASTAGRWPANLVHDGSAEVLAGFPVSKSAGLYLHPENGKSINTDKNVYGDYARTDYKNNYAGDTGSAARYFYCAKASKADRDEGLEGWEERQRVNGNKWTDTDYRVINGERTAGRESGPRRNHHPTVKPTSLMQWLVTLVTPPNGTVLDPFMGSGSTGKAAALLGFDFVGIDQDAEYLAIAEARIRHAASKLRQPALLGVSQ